MAEDSQPPMDPRAGIPDRAKGKTIEQQYQKKTQLEHILLRPDTYVGSCEAQSEKFWVFDERRRHMVQRQLSYVPGLYKIYDEILVNAADNFQRDPKSMDYIKIEINQEANLISIENNGKGLPVEIHKEHKMYVPEMVFGHLLTGDNYDDDEKKVTGGRNGYGAKLTNIFSTKFTIECGDSKRKRLYKQTWEDNMSKKGKASIKEDWGGKAFTKIIFQPDLAKFGMTRLDNDTVALLTRRAYDAAGSSDEKCRVYLNGNELEVRNFKDYVDLYLPQDNVIKCYERCGPRWEVVISISEGQFNQVSFVNSINTLKGGTHVDHVASQFVEAILKKVNAKNKGGVDVKPFHVRAHLWLFVNALIENPSFDSQTKETLTLKMSKFGSRCEVGDKTIANFVKSGIVDTVLEWAKAKESIDLQKKMKGGGRTTRLLGIPKLEDANWAGTKHSEDCTLILTEGDSAKALAVAGLSVVGRDRFGVFPLRGKLLNVREANHQQVLANAEIQNILQIVGLVPGRVYDNARGLRYGSVMIMADQDFDGSHIKGLLLNLFQYWWPSLFKLEGFMREFVTPIVKVTKAGSEIQFFSMPEYEKWLRANKNGRGWGSKYYKGLGTSTTKEAKEYFKNIEEHGLSFEYTGPNDDEAIDLAFNKKRADDRKDWINGYQEGTFVDHTKSTLKYVTFVNQELVLFSKYDVMRSIPSVVDGFKPSQRKVLFACFKRNLRSDMKVAQLAGYVAEHAAYHHGEASLQGTIVNMAQTFVGSNNINLLFPSGQFGTRGQGGKDHASARYIYTRLERIARLIYHPDDDGLLEYQNEEGQSIEPKWYIPVIPMVLVNGADGIGTGWSTFCPNHNPRDVIHNLKRFIKNQELETLCPWYKNFKGSITLSDVKAQGYDCTGVIEKRNGQLEITELPIRKWTQDYKEFLQTKLVADEDGKKKKPKAAADGEGGDDAGGGGGGGGGDAKKKPDVKELKAFLNDIHEYHADNTVHFALSMTAQHLKDCESRGFENVFKLKGSLSTSNLVFFDHHGKIKKYESEKDVIADFANLRLSYYQKRKDHLQKKLQQEKTILDEKVRFILMVIENKLKISNRKKVDLIKDLKKHNFKTMGQITGKEEDSPAEGEDLEKEQEGKEFGAKEQEKKEKGSGYDYLLGMPIWSLTHEKVEELKRQAKEKTAELIELQKKSPKDLWTKDLDEILKELEYIDREEEAERQEWAAKGKAGAASRKGGAAGKPVRRRRRPAEAEKEEDDDDDDDDEVEPPPKKVKLTRAGAPVGEDQKDFMKRLAERQKSRRDSDKFDPKEFSFLKKPKTG